MLVKEKTDEADEGGPSENSQRTHQESANEAELFSSRASLSDLFVLFNDELIVSNHNLLLLFLDGDQFLKTGFFFHSLLDFFLGLPLDLESLVLSLRRIYIKYPLLSMES